jgi:hypothetical protein
MLFARTVSRCSSWDLSEITRCGGSTGWVRNDRVTRRFESESLRLSLDTVQSGNMAERVGLETASQNAINTG